MTRRSNTISNFPCTVRQCPVVLTSLNGSLVCTTVSTLNYNAMDLLNAGMFYLVVICDATDEFLPGDNKDLLN